MKSVIAIVVTALYMMGVFRLGYSLQRIDHADVYIDGHVCQVYSLPATNGACSIKANMAGRLDGGWAITPVDRHMGTFYVDTNDLSYTYTRDQWHLAYGGIYILFGLLISGMAIVIFSAWRTIAKMGAKSRSESH